MFDLQVTPWSVEPCQLKEAEPSKRYACAFVMAEMIEIVPNMTSGREIITRTPVRERAGR
jgi:hypothetical protein